ncbi:TetR/AcrR family transcriptional regulator [Pseudonocardia xinjiangensis]|uniref:TetR/AcrR family transcriptional regulator n=1 Tax=Pseudonocardia xinjiangensis TaxID=75289 RepID=A0ABX1RFW7_9PSEU|nr:TetR/AcrR family transcriptional regulator [Pseudonocardia xinjiangensis]NMH78524.1 TetR/AcrR family transcriptional regulator [Pseudonocardia xinjiangensis]
MTDPPRRRDRAATHAALLEAAQRRFASEGYDAVSVRDVAADAGVDAALVFRYFGSKAGLFRAATSPLPAPADLADGSAEALPGRLLRAVVPDAGQPVGEEQLLALLRSSGHAEARAQLHRQMCDGYVAALAELAEEPGRDLRAELVGALLLGISLQRSVVGTPALAAASAAEIEPLFDAAVTALLGSTGHGKRADSPDSPENQGAGQ